MNFTSFLDKSKYAYAVKPYAEADIVILGAPYDFTASNRAGARFGPVAIRNESYTGIEEFSPYFRINVSDLNVCDLGDLDLPISDKQKSLDTIYSAVRQIVKDGKIPFLLGGEHLVTYPAFKAVHEVYPDVVIVHLDAHLDLIDELYGSAWSHGTVMRRCYELIGEDKRIYQFGIRSGAREEFEWAENHTVLTPFSLKQGFHHLALLKGKPVYFTLDLDVFDPAQLPGTGTTESGGIFFNEFMDFLIEIKNLNLQIVGCDVVELAPDLDPTHASATMATKIVRELLCVI